MVSTLAVASPHNGKFNEFLKGKKQYTFPLWTRAELLLASEHVFRRDVSDGSMLPSEGIEASLAAASTLLEEPSLPLQRETLASVISKQMRPADLVFCVGSVPRGVFDKAGGYADDVVKALALTSGLTETQLAALSLGTDVLQGAKLSNKIVHQDAARTGEGQFQHTPIWRFASPLVVHQIVTMLGIRKFDMFQSVLSHISQFPLLATSYGNLFETAAHRVLSKPGKPLTLRWLPPSSSVPFKNISTPVCVDESKPQGVLDSLPLKCNFIATGGTVLTGQGWQQQVRDAIAGKSMEEREKLYFVPEAHTFAGVDAFTGAGVMFQITVADSHRIALYADGRSTGVPFGGAYPVAQALGLDELHVVLVVPQVKQASYKRAQLLTVAGVQSSGDDKTAAQTSVKSAQQDLPEPEPSTEQQSKAVSSSPPESPHMTKKLTVHQYVCSLDDEDDHWKHALRRHHVEDLASKRKLQSPLWYTLHEQAVLAAAATKQAAAATKHDGEQLD